MAKEFLGRGWKFPVQIDPHTGRIAMSEAEQDTSEAIKIIVLTALGERLMRADFGCGIHELVFASVSRATLGLFESRIRDALLKWEHRAEVISLELKSENIASGELIIELKCRVRQTNNEFNVVFPYYLTEGRG
ncbi:MAG: GPW/gp25 family protein [Candidatus Binatia bacterium]